MAVVKIVNKRPKSRSGLKRTIRYVLRDDQEELFKAVTGPFVFDKVDSENVCDAFINEKSIWNKLDGRQCTHSIISWHRDELITAKEALMIGCEFAESYFAGYQTLVVVHDDKEHLHVHLVTNSVSFINGKKLHETRDGLTEMRRINDELCEKYGLVVTTKGKTYEGNDRVENTTWSLNKHKVMAQKSDIEKCFDAVEEAVSKSKSKDEFILNLKNLGWNVNWHDKRKHIVFYNENGRKFRDTNLTGTFARDISKDGLIRRFNSNRNVNKETIDILSELQPEIDNLVIDNPPSVLTKNSFKRKIIYLDQNQDCCEKEVFSKDR